MKNLLFLILTLTIAVNSSIAQQSVKDSTIKASGISLGYSYQIPKKDLANRFGNYSNIEVSFFRKYKSNFEWSINGSYLFGRNVIEPELLSNLTTSQGIVINSGGNPAEIAIDQRGFTATAGIAKVFPVFNSNLNSGIKIKFDIGYIWHKIKIEELDNTVAALTKDKLPGYDRLTGGLFIKQGIGYQFMSNNEMVNFYVGFETGQGFTKSLRTYSYDTALPDTESRLDIYYGIRICWMIPFYKRAPKEFYFD